MNGSTIKIRSMKSDDLDAVIGIDEKVLKVSRIAYYEMKFDKFFDANQFSPAKNIINLERRL